MDHRELITSLLDHIQGWCDELAGHEHGDRVIMRIEADMKEINERTEGLLDELIDPVYGVDMPPDDFQFEYLKNQLVYATGHEECRLATMLEF